jgi:farnesyl-diphosphate farnesyltransferase
MDHLELKNSFGVDLNKGTCTQPLAYCQFMLQKVSRTFALNIAVLPPKLRTQITLAYLFCRMADTLEDAPEASTEQKQQWLAAFLKVFLPENGAITHQNWEEFHKLLPQSWQDESPDRFLTFYGQWVLELVLLEEANTRKSLFYWIAEMSIGMRTFAQRQTPGQWLTLKDMDDLDNYCYYVAGTVGFMLSDLFSQHSPLITRSRFLRMKALSNSFGLGLQKTNILKDTMEDALRQVCFLPQSLLHEAKLSLANYADPKNREQLKTALLPLVQSTWNHLQDAALYTCIIPRLEPRMRLFCLWPLFMAAETLILWCEQFEDSVIQEVKITRTQVKNIIKQTTFMCWSNTWIQKRMKSYEFQLRAHFPLQNKTGLS